MKKKNISKKLQLNKTTIANIMQNEMAKVKGGEPGYTIGLNSCETLCNTYENNRCIGWVCHNPSEV